MNDPTTQYVRFLLGVIIVVVVSAMRYNRPSWSRSYTTAGNYYLTLSLYVFLYVVDFYLLSSIWTAIEVLRNPPRPGAPIPSPVVGPLAVTLLLPLIPAYDRWLREKLQRLAGIPLRGEDLASRIAEGEFTADDETTKDVKLVLQHRGIDTDQDWLAPAVPAQQLFLKAALLFYAMRAWEKTPRYKSFLAEAHRDFDSLRHRFDQLSLKISRTFGSIERLGTIEGDGAIDKPLKRVIGEMVAEMHEDVANFHKDTCMLCARGVLFSEMWHARRSAALTRLGIHPLPLAPELSYNPLFYAGVILLCTISPLFALVLRAPAITIPIPTLVIVIVATQICAMAIAVFAKPRWGFANAGISRRTPLLFVVGAGVAAMLFALLINIVTGVVVLRSFAGVVQRLRESYPYLPMAYATAAATAFLIQDHRWLFLTSRPAQRALDAATMGVAWWLASLVTLAIQRGEFDLVATGLIPLALGAVIGAVVPASFRDRRFIEARRVPDSPPSVTARSSPQTAATAATTY